MSESTCIFCMLSEKRDVLRQGFLRGIVPVIEVHMSDENCVDAGDNFMNQALPKKLWDQLGLVSILDTINGLSA
ncbi:hypothetical protein [Pseudomonas sp. Z1-12]|uniref:hypothetical protein n=1 Tax=Pseudomonas sp. Z1-12 TaxID=2817408 RepID=UPI003DA986C1